MRIKTILLDVDGTIMDFLQGQRNAFFSACEQLGHTADEKLYMMFDSINKDYWKKFERGEIEKNVLVFDRFRTLFRRANVSVDPIQMEEVYQDLLGEQCFFLDGAEDGVKYLAEKYQVHIVTNGVQSTQLRRLQKSGLLPYIGKVFISEEVGYQKPQKEFFDYCFQQLNGAEKKSTLIIGDSQTSDIQGGVNAQISTMWLNKNGEKRTVKSDFTVKNWEDILSIL